MNIKQCTIGILDTNDDPDIRFDDQGISHYYHDYKVAEAQMVKPNKEGEALLQALAKQIKQDGKDKPYDCILGLSGGVDSTYVALQAKRLGLRPLAVHLDNGWNSETSVKNIENIVTRLDIDLHTHVINWDEFKDLQLAYLKASVIDIEVVSDHAIFALLYQLAGQHGIKHILSGTNIVTEFIMPPHWIFNKADHINIQAIHKAFGSLPLKTYPFMNLKVKKWIQMVKKVRSHSIINNLAFNKSDVKQIIQTELGWQDYGGKHFESIFTRFYQGHILPTKFKVDKRRAHLTNLIYSGQITKEQALEELALPTYAPSLIKDDLDYVTKKLGLSLNEFEQIMQAPQVPHSDFPMEESIYKTYPFLKPFKGAANLTKKLLLR